MDSLPLPYEAHLNIINMVGDPIHIQSDFTDSKTILSMENYILKKIPVFELPLILKNIHVSTEGSSHSEILVKQSISMRGGKVCHIGMPNR